ncbi:hypothetical protein O9992_26005 [Vibrio lentus]|nr:hypothetical protein [Vibrio lentus]
MAAHLFARFQISRNTTFERNAFRYRDRADKAAPAKLMPLNIIGDCHGAPLNRCRLRTCNAQARRGDQAAISPFIRPPANQLAIIAVWARRHCVPTKQIANKETKLLLSSFHS